MCWQTLCNEKDLQILKLKQKLNQAEFLLSQIAPDNTNSRHQCTCNSTDVRTQLCASCFNILLHFLLLTTPVIKSSDVVVGGLGFYCDSSILIFVSYPTELTEGNLTKTCHMFGSECD